MEEQKADRRVNASNEVTRHALERIAQLAWRGYGDCAYCRRVYEICRDDIGVMDGGQWRAAR